MTELDFDELDKAVNSLMAENGTEEAPAPAPAPSAPAPDSSSSASAPAASPAVRRRGQFMDVIRPSSSMRPSPMAAKHEAATVTPPAADETPAEESPALSSPDMLSETSAEPSTEPASAPVSEWPDPIDMSVASAAAETPEMPAETEPSSEEPEQTVPAPEETAAEHIPDDPLTSPFLPDAKVEKRPLGVPAPVSSDAPFDQPIEAEPDIAPIETSDTGDIAVLPEEQSTDMGTVPAPVLVPDELKEDVVAVESNEVVHEENAPEPVPQEQPAPAAAAETAAPASEAVPAGGAITQQYEEQPSSGDQTNGAIYDTDTYHQPLDAHPAKKKSSVMTWVLWIIVLLIVGATAGAMWFYFTTQ